MLQDEVLNLAAPQLPHRVFIKDRELRYVGCNDRFAELLRLPRADIVGKTDYDFFPRELAEEYRHNDRHVMSSGTSQIYEERYVHGDRRAWVRTTKAPWRDAKGRVQGVIGIFEDITDRKGLEETILASEALYREVFSVIHDALFVIDVTPDDRFIIAAFNGAEERVTGYSSREIAGRYIEDAFSAAVVAAVRPRYQHCVEAGVTTSYEETLQVPLGERTFLTTLIPVRSARGRIYRLVGVAHDITERKQASDQLRRHLERLQATSDLDKAILEARSTQQIAASGLEHLNRLTPYWRASIMLLDTAARTVTVLMVRGAGRLRYQPGRSLPAGELFIEEEIPKLEHNEIMHRPDLSLLAEMPEAMQQLREDGMQSYLRIPNAVDGHTVVVLNIMSPQTHYFTPAMIEASRMILEHLAIAIQQALLREQVDRHTAELEERVRERTRELQTTNRTLEQANRELAQANQDLEAFTSSVSHDLRSPVSLISGYAEMLMRQPALPEHCNRYLKRILTATQRMTDLMDALLRLARASRSDIKLEPVDTASLVQEVRQELQVANERRTIEWRIAPLPSVLADASLLKVVFQNLLSNAIKFSSNCPHCIVEVGSRDADDDLPVIYVRDYGIGFDPTQADTLFGVFKRLHNASRFEGTGLGLAIVRRAVERHGGCIWAEGAPDHGATFYMKLQRPLH